MNNHKKRSKRRGFTMIEIIVVVLILGIVTAVAIPSMLGVINSGRQTNRENIARTVYLSAQGRLTELRITKNLKAEITGDYYDINGDELSDSTLMNFSTNVASQLGSNFPEEDSDNSAYVHYIVKGNGKSNPEDNTDANPVYRLLRSVILDDEVLNNSILIEYNIKTGVVLSVFYSDEVDSFIYSSSAGDKDNNVYGARGMGEDGYWETAKARNQGYYGARETGNIDDIIPASISVFDSYDVPLPDSSFENVLYAQIFVPRESVKEGNVFGLEINGVTVANVDLSSVSDGSFETLDFAFGDTLIYKYNEGVDSNSKMNRYIWILDYVNGNMSYESANYGLSNEKHSIESKYGSLAELTLTPESNINVGISGTMVATSYNEAHPYFLTTHQGAYANNEYLIATPRHLYNMRHKLDGNFTQQDDIDLIKINNIAPIGTAGDPFTGTLEGSNYTIGNLYMDQPEMNNVGLFGVIEEPSDRNEASIRNLVVSNSYVSGQNYVGSLVGTLKGSAYGIIVENPTVTGSEDVGGIVGVLDKSISGSYAKYKKAINEDSENNENVEGKTYFEIIGNANVGGLAGRTTEEGTVADSVLISAEGFETSKRQSHIVGRNNSVSVGGIIGNAEKGESSIRNLFLALAPSNGIKDENGQVVSASTEVYPIVGKLSVDGATTKSYYLGGEGHRPLLEEYNVVSSNQGFIKNTIEMYELLKDNTSVSSMLSEDWKRLMPNGTALTEEQALSLTNKIYPYPFIEATQANLVEEDWPIVGELVLTPINKVAYYEKYTDATYGFWFVQNDDGNGTLKNNKTISEAGYCIALREDDETWNTSGTQYFYFLDGESESEDYKNSGKSFSVTFNNDTNLKKGFASVYGYDINTTFVAKLPLDKLETYVTKSVPLKVAYARDNSGSGIRVLDGYLQPLFAKGVYEYEELEEGETSSNLAKDVDKFKIRTYWQFRNIEKVANSSSNNLPKNYTEGKTFKQEVEIDFTNMGIGVNHASSSSTASANLTRSVVKTSFKGIYDGNNQILKNITFGAVLSTETEYAGIFRMVDDVGEIRDWTVNNIKFVKSNNQYQSTSSIGGVSGINRGKIDGVVVESSQIGSKNSNGVTGGISANNQGQILNSDVKNSTIHNEGKGQVGGIAGINGGTVEACIVDSVDLTVTAGGYIGGIAGVNNTGGNVRENGVQFSTIEAGSATAGGIVADNKGIVKDTYFLSINEIDNIPITGNGNKIGGIVGNNEGSVSYSMYLAPSPKKVSGKNTTFYPLVGDGSETVKLGESDTCFYLDGSRYSLDDEETWINVIYNRVDSTEEGATVEISGGGNSNVTKFMDKEWIHALIDEDANLDNWYQPTTKYPYPVISKRIDAIPTKWVITDSPARPDQVDREDWETITDVSDLAKVVDFVNGDFSNHPNFYDYLSTQMGNIDGWYTRPTDASKNNDPKAYLIELQKPKSVNGVNYAEFAETDSQGGKGAYAELDAELAGTLYQIVPTTGGQEFYYSFYHNTRHKESYAKSDKMNFYLSPVDSDASMAKESDMNIIRPCWTPRRSKVGSPSGRDDINWNQAVITTVEYGQNTKFYDPKAGTQRSAFLYDVWISDLGYGITFWSNTNYGVGESDSTKIPSRGITSAQLASNSFTWTNDARNNNVGYWDISYGWKQYYGSYTIPQGQSRTEFAFRSMSAGGSTIGNYLDAITFKSPGYLSVEQKILVGDDEVTTVKGGEVLTIETNMKAYGEIEVDDIEFKNQLAPFDKYVDYQVNSSKNVEVTVKKNGSEIASSNYVVTQPTDNNLQTLSVKINESVGLNATDTITVTFNVKIRDEVKGLPGVTTALYYFRNQAVVKYTNDVNKGQPDGYDQEISINGSNISRITIDPIKTEKTVELAGNPSAVPIDGPFLITLTVRDSTDGVAVLNTQGLINDVIPNGFVISNYGNLPSNTKYEASSVDGTIRMTIPSVNLTAENFKSGISYYYTLSYVGEGYGIAYTNLSADYKYLFVSNGSEKISVLLNFPQPIVGIKPIARNDFYGALGTVTQRLDITLNDRVHEVLNDGNYFVSPTIEFVGATTSIDGNQAIVTDKYTAIIDRGTEQLVFTPKVNSDGIYEIQYYINLIAEKVGATSYDLSSSPATITLEVTHTDKVVYYEQYTDGTWGFTGVDLLPVPSLLDMQIVRDGTKTIYDSGYGVLSAKGASKSLVIDYNSGTPSNSAQTTANVSIDETGYVLYKFSRTASDAPWREKDNNKYVSNSTTKEIRFGNPGDLSIIGYIKKPY